MKFNKLVSIVTIVRNDAIGVEKTILSVLSQKSQSIEYILVDGDSTDGTLNIINRHRDSIDVVISEPDKGIYDAMNKGIAMSSGTYICMMNAGDFLEQDALRIVCDLIASQNEEPVVYYGDAYFLYSDMKIKRLVPARLEGLYRSMSICHQAIFIPRLLYEKYGPYDISYRYAADFHYLLQLLMEGEKFARIPVAIATFATGGTSDLRMYRSRLESVRILFRLRSPKRFSGSAHYVYEVVQHYVYFLLCKILGQTLAARLRKAVNNPRI
jgi:glycosyltransferase involved in cell wall biosynthesis